MYRWRPWANGRKEPTVHVSRKIGSEQKGRGGGREVMAQKKGNATEEGWSCITMTGMLSKRVGLILVRVGEPPLTENLIGNISKEVS